MPNLAKSTNPRHPASFSDGFADQPQTTHRFLPVPASFAERRATFDYVRRQDNWLTQQIASLKI